MKKLLLLVLAVGLCAPSAMSQEIVPVWEHLTNAPGGNPFFANMISHMGAIDGQATTDDMDYVTSLVRYDADRLLVFLNENGIDESNPEHDAALAAQWPDRSLIWLNAGDGSPLGVAKVVGYNPYPDREYYIQKSSGTHPDGPDTDRSWALNEIFPAMTVDDNGNVYTSDKHKLLRWTPDGNGGFNDPEFVWYYPEVDPPVSPQGQASGSQYYRAWRMWDLNCTTIGDKLVMTTSGRFWLDMNGTTYLSSTDGGATWNYDFHLGQNMGIVGNGGGCSAPITNAEWEEEWVFSTGFPGSSGFRKFVRPLGTEDWAQESSEFWAPQNDPADVTNVDKYMQWNQVDVATAPGIDFIATLCMPRWQSRGSEEFNTATAWLGLHAIGGDATGEFAGSHQLQYTEGDEPAPGGGDPWNNSYQNSINMYVNDGYADGAFEILWCMGGMGMGRYVVGDTDVPNWAVY